MQLQPVSSQRAEDFKLVVTAVEEARADQAMREEMAALPYESEESQRLALEWCQRRSQAQQRRERLGQG